MFPNHGFCHVIFFAPEGKYFRNSTHEDSEQQLLGQSWCANPLQHLHALYGQTYKGSGAGWMSL